VWLCAVLSLSATAAVGQPPAEPAELITDRPDQTESSSTVPVGSVQIEAGWLREEVDDTVTTESAPGVLLRIGVAEELELRVGWSGWVEEEVEPGPPHGGRTKISGSGDAELGLKWHLWSEKGNRPDAALLVGTSVPVGSAALTSDAWDPAFRFAFDHELSPTVGLAYNVGYAWDTVEGANGATSRAGAAIWTAALGVALNEKVGAFIELFGALPDGSAESSFDGGLTWLVGPALQLDLYAGVGLSSTAPDSFVGFGLSWRRPR
jgi:hypothetical protein